MSHYSKFSLLTASNGYRLILAGMITASMASIPGFASDETPAEYAGRDYAGAHSQMISRSVKEAEPQVVSEQEKLLRAHLASNPESAAAHASLAGYLLGQGQTKSSISYFQDAIILNPEEPKYFSALSVAYLHQKRYNMARAMVNEALRLQPEMQQADRILEYLDTKEQVLKMAQQANPDAVLQAEQMGMGMTTNVTAPDDIIHQPPLASPAPTSE